MAPNVRQINNVQTAGQSKLPLREECIVVKQGDTLTKLAKKFNMSVNEFKSWTGLDNSAISIGQKIKLPVAVAKDGKGIYAVAREYNMTMAEFAKLNNIQNPGEYKTAKNEVFYVKLKKNEEIKQKPEAKIEKSVKQDSPVQNKPVPKKQTNPKQQDVAKIQTQPKSEIKTNNEELNGAASAAMFGAIIGKHAENYKKWGSSYTPEEICTSIYKLSCDYYGAVGKPVFDSMINEINPKNASAVIEAYPNNEQNEDKESLLHTILREVRSTKESRKAAALKVYDALATEKNAPEAKRKEFEEELNNQFDSWGLINTEKLDSIIDEIIKIEIKKPSVPPKTKTVTLNKKPANNKTIVVPGNKKYPNQTMELLRRQAIESGKAEATEKFKKYCKTTGIKFDASLLDFGPIERYPYPTVSGTSITTLDEGTFEPTGKANGKVVIINPGHGGYSNNMGYFDPGSYSFIKKANGKYAPLLEYEKMQAYKQEAIEKLRAQGYTVVVANAHLNTFTSEKSFSKIVQGLNDGSRIGKKYDKKDIMFISLHADEQPGASGSGICYDSRFADDTRLAKIMQSNLNEDDWIKADLSERNWNIPKKGLQVLYQTESIPSVLLEVEYVDGSRCKNLDSSAYQTRFIDKMIEGINEYFKI